VSTDTLPAFRMARRKKNAFTLRMKTIRSVETSVNFYQLIPRNVPEDANPHQYIFEDTISFSRYVFVLRMKADVPKVHAVIQLPNVRYTFHREEKGIPENLTL
jgi:hypothetical protein